MVCPDNPVIFGMNCRMQGLCQFVGISTPMLMFGFENSGSHGKSSPCRGLFDRQPTIAHGSRRPSTSPFDFAQGRPFGSAQDGERKSNREPIERRRPVACIYLLWALRP